MKRPAATGLFGEKETVTTLLAKANSFLEHACGIPLRYVLKAPSEPQTFVSHFGWVNHLYYIVALLYPVFKKGERG